MTGVPRKQKAIRHLKQGKATERTKRTMGKIKKTIHCRCALKL